MRHDREDWTVADYLDAIRRGDRTAPERFSLCARRLALAKARRMSLLQEDAEDAAQEAYCAAIGEDHAALERLKNPFTSLSGWIAGVLEHILAKLIRRRAQALAGSPPAVPEWHLAQRLQLAAERTTHLGREGSARLGELTPRERGAFELHLEGLPMATIAKRLGIGREAARERTWRSWALLMAPTRPPLHVDLIALLGPNGPWMSPVERETLVSLAAGENYAQAAINRGESPSALRSRVQRVRRRARRAGDEPIPPAPRPSALLLQGAHARPEAACHVELNCLTNQPRTTESPR